MGKAKHTVIKLLSIIMQVLSLPGFAVYKTLLLFEQWNGPEIIAIGSIGSCIYKLIDANKTGFDSVWHLFGLCLMLALAIMFSLSIARFVVDVLQDIFNPFYVIHCDTKKRLEKLKDYKKPEMTLEEYVQKMRTLSAYGMEKRPRY